MMAPLDYSTKSGASVYSHGSSPLQYVLGMPTRSQDGVLISHLAPFVKALKGRAELLNGIGIFNTTITDANGAQVQINLLDRYTDGKLAQVQAEALARRVNVDPTTAPAQYRQAQISEMLYSAMTKSLDRKSVV